VSQRLSRAVDEYKSPPPAARAARQWLEAGKPVSPGQVMRFVYTRGHPGVWALGCGELDGGAVDAVRYMTLLNRAVGSVLNVFGAYSSENPKMVI
jgi:DNA polymerase elongation subunit (family B)